MSRSATIVSRIPSTLITLTNQFTILLTPNNYIYWRTQVVLILQSNLIYSFVDGSLSCPPDQVSNPAAGTDGAAATITNPEFSAWHQQDQSILSAIVSSLSKGVIGMVVLATTS
jgi:hypothetical protein